MADYIYMMESRLTPDQQRAVALVQELARAQEMNVYLTGGAIRDLISGFPIRDLDFTVQGNALKLQRELEKAGTVMQGVDEDLRSMYVLLPGNVRGEIAMARVRALREAGACRRRSPPAPSSMTSAAATSPSMPWRCRSIPARAACCSIPSTASPTSKPS